MTSKQKTYIVEEEKKEWSYLGEVLGFLGIALIGFLGILEVIGNEEFIWSFISSGTIFMVYFYCAMFDSLPKLIDNKKTVEKEVKLKEVKNGSRKTKKRV